MARLKNIVQKTEALGVVSEAQSSEVINVSGGQVLSCQVVNDVQATAKTFDSPEVADLVNQSLTYTAVTPGVAGNSITIALTSPGSGTHALAISVVGSAIAASLQSTAAVAATGTLDLTADIVLTSVATGTARNTNTFTTQVLPAAANPGATILALFNGTAAAIVCTITPNDGTNNGAVPVDLTTAQLRELITTGAVVGKTVTITDASNFRVLQTATGGGATPLADGGEGDGVVATFTGGAAFALVSTGDEVKAAINADNAANDLVLVSGSNGAAVTTLAATPLANGDDGDIDLEASEITITDHGYQTGCEGNLSATGTLPAPLDDSTDYFIIKIDANTIAFAESREDAYDGVYVELSDDGSDGNVSTFTPTTLTSASIKLQKSNDGSNWSDEGSATEITADGNFFLDKVDPAATYYKAVIAIDDGSFDCTLNWLVKGIDG